MPLHRSALILLLTAGTLTACTQDEDQACQVRSDCDDGLVCSISEGSLRGTCVPPEENREDSGAPDGGGDRVDPDASVRDASDDASDDASMDDSMDASDDASQDASDDAADDASDDAAIDASPDDDAG